MDNMFEVADGYRNWETFVDTLRAIERSLQESKKTERTLVQRCDEMKSELVVSGNKLHAVMRVRTEDERTMALLRKECERSTLSSMDSKQKEEEARSLVSALQTDIEQLQTQVGVLQSSLWLEKERANAATKSSRKAVTSALKKGNISKRSAFATATVAKEAFPGVGGAATSAPEKRGFRLKAQCGRPRTTSALGSGEKLLKDKLRGNFRGERLGLVAGSVAMGSGCGGYDDGGLDYWVQGSEAVGNKYVPRSWEGDGDSTTPCAHCSLNPHHDGAFVLDLDGQGGEGMFGSGARGKANGPPEATTATPFQRWKQERGILSQGVAEIFGNGG